MENIEKMLIDIVKEDSTPALGCTEPAAVAYASSLANKYITGKIKRVEVTTSKSIFKNGKSVTIPKTDESGLDLATALGIVINDSDSGLMILRKVNESIINEAKKIINDGIISLKIEEESPSVYVYVCIESENEKVEVELKNSHTHIEWIKVNDEKVYDNKYESESTSYALLGKMTFRQIKKIVENMDIESIDFVKDGIEMNNNAANEGLKSSVGLKVGLTLTKLSEQGKLNLDIFTKTRLLTAAACDMRMGGGECPIMTSGGSGNQGIGVILPIAVVAEFENIEEEKVIRAIFFAHIINRYVKMYTGKLSAICGCAIAAGVGAAVGITCMLGCDDDKIDGSAMNMLANLTGMICDGAKNTCSLKLSTSAQEAVLSAYMAKEGTIVDKNVGVIGETIEESIKNLGYLCISGFSNADNAIIDIINKNSI